MLSRQVAFSTGYTTSALEPIGGRGRVSIPARPNLYLVDPGTHMGNRVSNSVIAVSSGEQVVQHNIAIYDNIDVPPMSVLASSLEHTATDCQSSGPVPLVEVGNIASPQLDRVTSGQITQSRPSHPWTEDPE